MTSTASVRLLEDARASSAASLTLPRRPVRRETLPPSALAARRALVIDDNPPRRSWVTTVLRAEGLDVDELYGDEDLERCLAQRQPDVVLLATDRHPDLVRSLCARLRRRAVDDARSLVAYGGGDDELRAQLVLESGADDHVSDPYRGRELRARIRVQLGHLRDREVMRWARAQRTSLRDMALTDGLTGIANRRAISLAIEDALARQEPVTLLMLDLDHFKRINDTAGHAAGDDVLQLVASALDACTPPGSVAARWGGEEFTVLLRGDDADEPERDAERFRHAVSSVGWFDGKRQRTVTASVGAARWAGTGTPPSTGELVGTADRGLYDCKRQGRDRVCGVTLTPSYAPGDTVEEELSRMLAAGH